MRRFIRHVLSCATACGVVASFASGDVGYDFNASGQGFTSEFISAPFDGPWAYTPVIGVNGTGGWGTPGQASEIGHPCTVDLVAPMYTVGRTGVLRLEFNHRFSFEYNGTRWDGGAIFVSVNGGAATYLPVTAFVTGGYDNKLAANTSSVLKGQFGFTAKSAGYDSESFITSVANLGPFNVGDRVEVRFRFAGDTNTTGGVPTWAIDNVSLREGFSGSALTYQGVLRDGGVAITGPVDMRFSLYSSATSTALADLISGPIAMPGVAVGTGGVVTVPIDFGTGAFDDRVKWIEVEIKQGPTYVKMLPRAAVTSAPTAVYATKAGTVPWTGVTGIPANLGVWNTAAGGIQYAAGNVGVGTTSPQATLHVTSAESTQQLKVSAGPSALFGAFLSLDASAVTGGHEWLMFSSGGSATEGSSKLIFRNFTNGAYGATMDSAGRVGIQNLSPEQTLDVNGTIGVQNGPGGVFFSRSTAAIPEPWMWPRWTDDWMYTNFGANGWSIRTNDNMPVMALLPSGNVGIGTTTPGFRLHVAGANALQAQIESNSASGTWFNLLNTSPGGFYWRMISTGSGTGEGPGKLVIGVGSAPNNNATVMTLMPNGFVGIGTPTPTQRLTVAGNVLANNVAVPSSGRFKDHVTPMDDALDSLLKLEGVRFDWKPEWAKARPGREHDIGFVAEDVAKVFPEVVFYDDEGNVTGMDYSRLTAVAIEAIKQQQARFDAELTKRDRENAELRVRLEKLEKMLAGSEIGGAEKK